MTYSAEDSKIKTWGLWVIFSVFILVAFIRVTGPTDIHRGDQWKQADYLVDIMVRGNWLIQHHNGDEIASKPPLYNWLAAPLMILKGEPNDFLLKLPSLIAGLLTLLLIWNLVGRLMGWRVALYSGLFLVTSSMFAKQMYFARTDMLMVMLIVMQIWAVFRFLENSCNKKYLVILWVAGGLGVLTKGPLVVLMPHLVFIAWWIWEGKLKSNYKRLGLSWGIPLLFLPTALWIGAILTFEGLDSLGLGYDKWVVTETANRFDPNSEPGETRGLFYYLLPSIARTMPWSVFTLLGLYWIPWRSLRKNLSSENKGLILSVCWIVALLLMLSVVPSKRIVRIFPIVPAVCILAAWGYDRLLQKYRSTYLSTSKEIIAGVLLIGVVILGIGLDKHIFSEPARRPDIQYARELSDSLRSEVSETGAEIIVHSSLGQPWRYFLLQPESSKSTEEIIELVKSKEFEQFYIIGKDDPLVLLESLLTSERLVSVEWMEQVGNIKIEGGVGVVHSIKREP